MVLLNIAARAIVGYAVGHVIGEVAGRAAVKVKTKLATARRQQLVRKYVDEHNSCVSLLSQFDDKLSHDVIAERAHRHALLRAHEGGLDFQGIAQLKSILLTAQNSTVAPQPETAD